MDIVKLAADAGFEELSVVENYSMFFQFAQAVLRQNNDFYNAVVDELVCCHIYSKEHDSNPRKAIQDMIKWNCDVALDPAVSRDAQALIDRGVKLERDACANLAAVLRDPRPASDPGRYLPGAYEASMLTANAIHSAIRERDNLLTDSQNSDYNTDMNF